MKQILIIALIQLCFSSSLLAKNNGFASESGNSAIPPSDCCTAADITFAYTGLTYLSKTFNLEYRFQGSACSGKQFSITASGCPDPTLSYSWNMGDGTTLNGQTISHTYTTTTNYSISLTISGASCSTSILTIDMTSLNCCCNEPVIAVLGPGATVASPTDLCAGSTLSIMALCDGADDSNFSWNFGDNSASATGASVTHIYATAGTYTITATQTTPAYCGSNINTFTVTAVVPECLPCTSCIGSFAPDPGEYIASVWVRETNPVNENIFSDAEIEISFSGFSTVTSITASSANKIIDGWQLIEGKFSVPAGASNITIELKNNSTGSNEVYFDDIRIHPYKASMKSYVYDPITLRLVAELDERNYATFYEYDEEGVLIRVKKETEKGIMTIKETRQNNSK